MAYTQHVGNEFPSRFFADVFQLYPQSSRQYRRTDLPAYQIVLLDKHRWHIEKIFHQFKSKMVERKSWASFLDAKQSHAIFECLAHNLLLLFNQKISQAFR